MAHCWPTLGAGRVRTSARPASSRAVGSSLRVAARLLRVVGTVAPFNCALLPRLRESQALRVPPLWPLPANRPRRVNAPDLVRESTHDVLGPGRGQPAAGIADPAGRHHRAVAARPRLRGRAAASAWARPSASPSRRPTTRPARAAGRGPVRSGSSPTRSSRTPRSRSRPLAASRLSVSGRAGRRRAVPGLELRARRGRGRAPLGGDAALAVARRRRPRRRRRRGRPGGFAHGDYLRPGAIARFSPVMDAVGEFAASGGPGRRHLQRLPGAHRGRAAARRAAEEPRPEVPVHHRRPAGRDHRVGAHQRGRTGRCAAHPDQPLRGQLHLRRRDARPAASRGPHRAPLRRQPQRRRSTTSPASANEGGNVVGLMPHPERASHALLGSTDGVPLLQSLLTAAGLGTRPRQACRPWGHRPLGMLALFRMAAGTPTSRHAA